MLNSIHSDLIRGHIDTIILSVLHEGDRYGYDILGEIERKSGGEYVLKQPTLYSCLKRLETQGFIYKYWGTETNGGRRTYYSLTEMGKELFQHNKDEWNYSRHVIDKLISTPKDPSTVIQTAEIPEFATEPNSEKLFESAAESTENESDPIIESVSPIAVDSDVTETTEIVLAEKEAESAVESVADQLTDEYANVLAEAEKDEILTAKFDGSTINCAQIKGVSYADRLSHDKEEAEKRADEDEKEIFGGTPFFAHDYFSDKNESDDEEEVFTDVETVDTTDEEEVSTAYPSQAFYKDEDFIADDDSDQSSMFDCSSTSADRMSFGGKPAGRTTDGHSGSSVFKSYDNAVLSEETDREIVVGREYLGVIKRLLSGDTDADTYYSKLSEVGSTTLSEDERQQTAAGDETPSFFAEAQPPAEVGDDGANFDDLLVSVRSMGDEIRIRTHSRSVNKEYNSLYHYYSNKLLLFKYGIMFAIMILEIIIPYFIIKFGFNVFPIAGELPVLVISVVGAALLPIYAISAFLIDPYKRKRFDFDLKNSILYRCGIMFLTLILIYAVNVVFYMDISLEIEYAFSLATPALLATNIPLSALIFKGLYGTKRFGTE